MNIPVAADGTLSISALDRRARQPRRAARRARPRHRFFRLPARHRADQRRRLRSEGRPFRNPARFAIIGLATHLEMITTRTTLSALRQPRPRCPLCAPYADLRLFAALKVRSSDARLGAANRASYARRSTREGVLSLSPVSADMAPLKRYPREQKQRVVGGGIASEPVVV